MTDNIEGWAVVWTAETVTLRFTDLFGAGEAYSFPKSEAAGIRDGMIAALAGLAPHCASCTCGSAGYEGAMMSQTPNPPPPPTPPNPTTPTPPSPPPSGG